MAINNRMKKLKPYLEFLSLILSIIVSITTFFADYLKSGSGSAWGAILETIKVHEAYIYIATLGVIAYWAIVEFRSQKSKFQLIISDLRSEIISQKKNLKKICQISHDISHKLRDTIANMRDLNSDWDQKIDDAELAIENLQDELGKLRDDAFRDLEKILCNNGWGIINHLKESIQAILQHLSFKDQEIRIIVKLVESEGLDTGPDGSQRFDQEKARVDCAIWDTDSWLKIRDEIKKHPPAYELRTSTALRAFFDKDINFYYHNDSDALPFYNTGIEIFEQGFIGKLVVPIRCRYTDDNIMLFGFLTVLFENPAKEELLVNDRNSLIVATVAAVADQLAVLIEAIHYSNLDIEYKLFEKECAVLQNRRVGD